MSRPGKLKFDVIGYWSEVKLHIVREYAQGYSTVFSGENQAHRFQHVYIDAFAGAGRHVSKSSGEWVPGSPLNALMTEPPFREYHFIDLDGGKVDSLRGLVGNRPDVHFYEGDCNRVLLDEVFPKVQYKDYRRGLCLLDPYGLHLNWEVIRAAGEMKSIDLFLNFPMMDMNRNVIWRKLKKEIPAEVARMTSFWGDESWRSVAYEQVPSLFPDWEEKSDNDTVAQAFRERLRAIAGFTNVPEPVPMRNSIGKTVYYLFFASQKPVAQGIVSDIFKKYQNHGAS